MSVRLRDVIDVLDAGLPATACPVVGLGRPGVRRPGGRAGLGDDRGRRHAGGGRRGSRGRPAAGPSPVAAARGGHGRGQHTQRRADPPLDPHRAVAVHRAHQCRLGIAGCVGRAGARPWSDRRSRAGAGVCRGPDWTNGSSIVPGEHAEAVQAAVFEAGAGHIGDYSQCSWSVAGTGQFLPHDGASPAIGSVGTVERVAEDRFEVVAPARARAAVLVGDARRPPLRGARVRHLRAGGAARRCRVGPDRDAAAAGSVARLRLLASVPHCRRRPGECARRGIPTRWCRGSRSAVAPATRCWATRPPRACRPMSRPICGTTPPTSIAGPRNVRFDRRRALGQRIPLVRTRPPTCCGADSARRCRCGCAPSAPTRGTSRDWWRSVMKAEVAQQRSLLEVSKLDADLSRIAHRTAHLPQREAYERVQAEHSAANDRLAAVRIALGGLGRPGFAVRVRDRCGASARRPGPGTAQSGSDGRQAIVGTAARAGDACNVARPAWRIRCSR